jgi:excisionase family DNA binding protein
MLLTISDLSLQLIMKPKTVYAKAKALEILCFKLGRLIRFKQDEIDAWLETCRNSKPCPSEKVSRKRRTSCKSSNHLSTIITKAMK